MDRRIKYTKKVIKDTLISLLKEKDINKITVSEICKQSDINRATFYRYYLDAYNLLDSIQEELVTELKEACYKTEDSDSFTSFAKELLIVFTNNKELVKILFNTKYNRDFFSDIFEIAYDKFKDRWEEACIVNEEYIEYASIYIFNGALGVINYWVKCDFDKDVSEIAKLIETISSNCLRSLKFKI